jgi:hypothetical protein
MKACHTMAFAIALATAVPVHAAVIYDNGGGPPLNAFESDADTSGGSVFRADDFSLAAGANIIGDIHWTGAYAFNNTPGTDNFTIQFFADAGGTPALAALHTFNVGSAVNRTDTGVDISGIDIYSYSVDIAPLALPSGTFFWLSIFNDTSSDADDEWFWGGQNLVGASVFRGTAGDPWTATDLLMDFQLTSPSAAVSEPAALWLVGLALVGLSLRRRLGNP